MERPFLGRELKNTGSISLFPLVQEGKEIGSFHRKIVPTQFAAPN
jgi:hypothetical protein